jgi:hypothetical protein
MPEPYTEPSASQPARAPHSLRDVLRGLFAVAGLFAGAADALVTAFLGVPRLGWLARRAGEAAARTYRRAAWEAADEDAEIIDDPGNEPGEERQEGGTDGGRTPADTGA